MHPLLGDVTLVTSLPPDAREFSLLVRAANPPPGASATLPLQVIAIPTETAAPRLTTSTIIAEVPEDAPRGTEVARLETSGAGVWFELSGDVTAAFELNPTAGVVTTARRLDYETAPLHELIVRATDAVRRDGDLVRFSDFRLDGLVSARVRNATRIARFLFIEYVNR